MSPASQNFIAPDSGPQARMLFQLWIDSVGAYLVSFHPQIRIGGANRADVDSAEIGLLSNLSRTHARVLRSGEVWLLEPFAMTSIDQAPVTRHRLLNDGNLLRLGDSVELRFRQPSPLSATARLDFVSGHRTQPAVDGVILFAETCVMGSTSDSHLPAPAGSDRVILIRRPSGVWCKAEHGIEIDGVASGTEVACETGRVYAGQGWCFRWE